MENKKFRTQGPQQRSQQGLIAIVVIIFVLVLATWFFLNQQPDKSKFSVEPTVSFAHGTFYWSDKISKPDTEYVLEMHNHYILKYQGKLHKKELGESQRLKNTIFDLVSNDVLANGLYIDWLIQQSGKEKFSQDSLTNRNLRWYYTSTIQQDPLPVSSEGYWTKGIDIKTLKALQSKGLDIFEKVTEMDATYRENCISAGVPVPNKLFDGQWDSFGEVDKVPGFNDLGMYLSEQPPGVCISLTRSTGPGETKGHIDLICMGQQSSQACFFEAIGYDNNIQGVRDISELYGGANIPFGGGSAAPCTNCHIGENALIVHPQDPAFSNSLQAKSMALGGPTNWNSSNYYQAFGAPNWPSNPPPFNLSIIPSDKFCTTCHVKSDAGRFPNVAKMPDPSAYSGYCNVVLDRALGNEPTMPLGDLADSDKYAGIKIT